MITVNKEIRVGDILVMVGMVAACLLFIFRDRTSVVASMTSQIAEVQRQLTDVQIKTTEILARHDTQIGANAAAVKQHGDQIFNLYQIKADK